MNGKDIFLGLKYVGDDLIEKAQEINPNPSKREMDMLLSTGEQISVSLCCMALRICAPARVKYSFISRILSLRAVLIFPRRNITFSFGKSFSCSCGIL